MNKLIGISIIVLIAFSCKKEEVFEDEIGFVSVVNAVPNSPLAVYIDTAFQVSIPNRASTRNLQVSPGSHNISVRDSARIKTLLALPSQEFVNGKSTTIIAYDTLHPIDSTIKVIRLTDDLTLAPSGFVKVRFIHAAPRTPSVDITFLRTSVTPPDSLTFPMQSYIGFVPNDPALSAFNIIPIGDYTLKIKMAGTQDTIMNTTKLSVANLAGFAGISGITTLYLGGGAQSQPLSIGSLRHYP